MDDKDKIVDVNHYDDKVVVKFADDQLVVLDGEDIRQDHVSLNPHTLELGNLENAAELKP